MGKWLSAMADYFRETDKKMLFLCLFATCFGCLAVLSATHYTNSLRQFFMQVGAMLVGLFAAVVISLIDFEHYLKRWYAFAAIGLIPVLLTFVVGVGPAGTDDKAWLDLGITTFQPSELMKACFIITFSYHLSRVSEHINEWRYLIPVCLHGGMPVLLIHFQGDDGTALIFAVMVVCMMWGAGVKKRYFAILAGLIVVAAPLAYLFVLNADQQARIRLMLDMEADLQGDGWQQWRGRVALAGGGWFGQGFLRGTLTQLGKAGVPEGYNDFIFTTIGEEWGMIGCLVVVGVLFGIAFRCLQVAKQTRKLSGQLICYGFFGQMMAQIAVNLGMCLSLLPVVGVTLPFFSAGGTSLSCLYLGVGLMLCVWRHRDTRELHLHS